MSYEIWSEGKLRQRLAGLNLHFARGTHVGVFDEEWEYESTCDLLKDPMPQNVRRRIVLELVQLLEADAVWVVSPLDTLVFGSRPNDPGPPVMETL